VILHHGLVVDGGHDVGGQVITTMESDPVGFWHCCDNDEHRAVWFAWHPAGEGQVIDNPIVGDGRIIDGTWEIGEPPARYPRDLGGLLIPEGVDIG